MIIEILLVTISFIILDYNSERERWIDCIALILILVAFLIMLNT